MRRVPTSTTGAHPPSGAGDKRADGASPVLAFDNGQRWVLRAATRIRSPGRSYEFARGAAQSCRSARAIEDQYLGMIFYGFQYQNGFDSGGKSWRPPACGD